MKIKAHYYTIMKRQRFGLLSEKREAELSRFLLARHCFKRNFFVVFKRYGPVTKPNLFFWKSTRHCWGARWSWGKKKQVRGLKPWESGHPSFLSQSSSSSNCDLGSVPGSGTWIPPLLSYPAQEEGWRGGELGPAPRDCGCPGCTTLQVHAAPQPWKQFAPSSHKLRHWLVSEQVCSRVPPAGHPRIGPGLPTGASAARKRPAIILPFAEKPPIYRSFSPRSFLLRRTPGFPAPKRSPPWLGFKTLSFLQATSPSHCLRLQGTLSSHTPILPQTRTYFHPPASCRGAPAPVAGPGGRVGGASPTSAIWFWGPLSPPR